MTAKEKVVDNEKHAIKQEMGTETIGAVDSLVINGPVHFTRAMFPVGHFTFMQDEVSAKLHIQDDITPLESANLCVMLAQAAAAVTSVSSFAWMDYINQKNLQRHFEIKDYR